MFLRRPLADSRLSRAVFYCAAYQPFAVLQRIAFRSPQPASTVLCGRERRYVRQGGYRTGGEGLVERQCLLVTVADAMDGFDDARLTGVDLDPFAELRDVLVERAAVG